MDFDDIDDISLVNKARNELHKIRKSGLSYSDKYYKIVFHRGNAYCNVDLDIVLRAKTLEEAYLKMCKYLTENSNNQYVDILEERIEYYKNIYDKTDDEIDVSQFVDWLMRSIVSNDELWLKEIKVI